MASDGCSYHMTKDVTVEILSNLPVKSLMRFKCVCKNWNSVMSTSFIRKHFHRPNNKAHLVVQHYNYVTRRYGLAMFSDETLAKEPFEYHDLDLLQMTTFQDLFIGPMDGVIGFYDRSDRDRDRIALWNPALKEFKVLPVPYPNYFSRSHRPFIHIFGMGMDIATNNYKLVLIRRFWDEEKDNPYIPRVVNVYNLSTNSWRVFDAEVASESSIENSMCNTYKNGVCYWITTHDLRNHGVISFDLSTETFEEIAGPPSMPESQWADLVMYGDSIAMMFHVPHDDEKSFDIWVLKEDGFWSKEVSIGPMTEVERPRGVWKNWGLLVETDTAELVLYDHNIDKSKDLRLRGYKFCPRAFTYKESLVSIVGENECREGDNCNFHLREPDNINIGLNEFLQCDSQSIAVAK